MSLPTPAALRPPIHRSIFPDAHVGGVSLHELNRMELSMLRMLSYRAQVGAEELAEHLLVGWYTSTGLP